MFCKRRAYGYRDEEYLKLKIVAAFLPAITQKCSFQPTRIRVDPKKQTSYLALDMSDDAMAKLKAAQQTTNADAKALFKSIDDLADATNSYIKSLK